MKNQGICDIILLWNCYGRVVESVYTADLKSVALRLAGSSPASATILRGVNLTESAS